jgi:hypothetical protein
VPISEPTSHEPTAPNPIALAAAIPPYAMPIAASMNGAEAIAASNTF